MAEQTPAGSHPPFDIGLDNPAAAGGVVDGGVFDDAIPQERPISIDDDANPRYREESHAIPPPARPSRIPDAIDPRQRIAVVRRAKWGLLLGIMALFVFAKTLAWHYWEPLNDFLNDGRPVVTDVTFGNFTTRSFVPTSPRQPFSSQRIEASKVANLSELVKIYDYDRKRPEQSNPTNRINIPVDRQTGKVLYDEVFLWLKPGEIPREKTLYYFIDIATLLAALLVTALPRLLFPKQFGSWKEPADAMRDWLVVGALTSILASLFTNIVRLVPGAPRDLGTVNLSWLFWQYPVYFFAAVIGLAVARWFSTARGGLLSSRTGVMLLQIILQAILVSALIYPLDHFLIDPLMRIPYAFALMGIVTLVLLGIAFSTILRAYRFDKNLQRIQGSGRGVLIAGKPLDLNVTIIGGKESGKSVFLAAAYYQWNNILGGSIRIQPHRTHRQLGGIDADTDLQAIAGTLYNGHDPDSDPRGWFPSGTADVREYKFELHYRPSSGGTFHIANFTLLDYPGVALKGRAATQEIVDRVYAHIDRTDAVLFVADMSAMRRGMNEKDFFDVTLAYNEIVERVLPQSGKYRVVPLGVILTKCDEFTDLETGQLKVSEIDQKLRMSLLPNLIQNWENESKLIGPGFARHRSFYTSAITNSTPQRKSDGTYDYAKPFLPYEPPPVRPSNCLPPLLWLFSEAIRWNMTAFSDLRGFLLGSTALTKRQQDAIDELDRWIQDPKFTQ